MDANCYSVTHLAFYPPRKAHSQGLLPSEMSAREGAVLKLSAGEQCLARHAETCKPGLQLPFVMRLLEHIQARASGVGKRRGTKEPQVSPVPCNLLMSPWASLGYATFI